MSAHFMGLRDAGERTTNPILSASKDFISFWKYFCLFHDIAYPIEAAFICDCENKDQKGIVKIKNDEYKKYINMFDNIYLLSFCEWISIALARYITVYDLLYDPENKKFDQVFLDKKINYCINNSKVNYEELQKVFVDYTCIDKLFSYEHYKMFTGFIEKEDFLFVLMDNYTGNPIAFKKFDGNSVCYYRIEQYFDDLSSLDIEYYLDSGDGCPNDRFQVRFLVKNIPLQFNKIKIKFGQEQITPQNVRSIKRALKKNAKNKSDQQVLSHFDHITDASELDDYIFIYYKTICSFCSDIFTDKKEISSQVEVAEFKSKANEIIYYQTYNKSLHQKIKHTTEKHFDNNFSEIDKIIFEIILRNQKASTEARKDIMNAISKKLKKWCQTLIGLKFVMTHLTVSIP